MLDALAGRFLAATARLLDLRLAGTALVALRAGALPAAERLVAGFSRVDFFAANTLFRECEDTDEWRDVEREDDLFVVTLMRQALSFSRTASVKR